MLINRLIAAAARPSLLAPLPRLAPRSLPLLRTYASSPTPNSFPQLPPGFEKLAHSPSALSAITNLVEVMKQNGVDLHTGEKPSMWQMVKLARNQEVRDATTKVMEELKNAGVDVSPERLQSIMNSSGGIFGGDKGDGGKKE
ncbi:hypothetical protein PSEUBRA_005947 [Kalmanozyma brasiliensis GHG001]|uniref:Uncharacterized protein n=1 Tax=Kalmanozyma brasiliensis (strain GHG001) TaxID=1365824 RepID=V5EP22_KALBG|nr:uncharacterized protein PSEUBRA_005947 [Kalmanozyma brasiliensis GHG001]EST04673.1 hypothetical protein PSEUBRA_005947 [Kalmanozyma brasiliensis GHG001]